MRRRTWLRAVVLGGAAGLSPLLLAGCMVGPAPTYAGGQPPSILGGAPRPAVLREIAILAPLSGPNAVRGDALVKAAQLALAAPDAPKLDVRDTLGTPQGAAQAAQAAIAAGAGIIIGPLTAGETAAAAGPATAANVPVLAFTSDPAQARPGVWTLGITPGEQTRRLVQAVTAQGKTRIAALLPDTDFGRAMGAALSQEASGADIRFHSSSADSVQQSLRELSQYDQRKVQSQAGSAEPEPGIPAVASPADTGAPTLSGPPPFDALLLADTGSQLSLLTSFFSTYGITPPAVRVLGPALWSQASTRGGAALDGAWFAAPDPDAPAAFDQAYSGRYGVSPPGLADLAYDAASIARATAASGYAVPALTTPAGFPGADGLLGLLPDGHVRRALALFEIRGNAATVLEPAPSSLTAPGT